MQKQIESILLINKYLISNKNNNDKAKVIRGYLTSKIKLALLPSKDKKPLLLSLISQLPLIF